VLLSLSVFVFDPSKLYFELPWLDIPMHILGGFGVVSLALAVAAYKKHKITCITAMAIYLCVAVGWELYEMIKDLVNNTTFGSWQDTLSDIVNGAIGALVAWYLLKK